MYPFLLEIGPIRIASYGVMMAIGFLVGGYVFRKELGRRGLDVAMADRVVVAAIIGGIVGAKVFFLIEKHYEVFHNPVEMVFARAGLTWYGGLMGGTAATLWLLHRHRCLDLRVVDGIAPALTAGYFFGRGGCQLAGDGCYGVPTDLPWGMAYPEGIVPTLERVHPTPVYEMAAMAVIFGVLWFLRKRIATAGMLFCVYLVLAGAARFAVEFVRRNPAVALGLTVPQWFSLGMVAGGALWGGWLLWTRAGLREPTGAAGAPGVKRRGSASESLTAPQRRWVP